MELSTPEIEQVLICSITPYFLEKGNFWFEENLYKILEAKKAQSFFEDNILYLEKNQKISMSEVLRKIDELGYEKVLEVTDPGEFSQRGGIVDIFPINMNNAVRFEFLGNKIETIEKLAVEITDEKTAKDILQKRLKSQKLFSDLKGLKAGDYLVHLDHGIGRFSNIEKIEIPNPDKNKLPSQFSSKSLVQTQDYYILEYAKGDKLYVPVGLERKLSRYIGFADPKVSGLGSEIWQKTKRKIKEDAEKFAKDLLEIYAKRNISSRPPYSPDDEIDQKITDGFSYEETPDQLQALADIKNDLEKSEPMDRIVCGDVGFGKTEIAIRTLVKAVKSGYQAAMICPTTILASQHFQNFKERLKDLPVRISLISRMQTKKDQEKIKEGLKAGEIDIVVGTHRLLSKDIEFKSLGLLVIDDEQKFGVKQKERLKSLRASLDVLSLSATPIPRTLYMALSSLKKISMVQTPPAGRLAVKTFILPFREKTLKEAIQNELSRGGQIYYLHNRVETIESVKKSLENLIHNLKPVSMGVAHGRMREKELISTMEAFKNKKIDILIATTIIENGIDLANANTLIVEDASKLGLSQAYQLRGRVGRSHKQAFAYLFHPRKLSPVAKARLDALKEAEELGSGYRIALKDLEIRGAGNILGREQSGSVNRVGLNLYCQMLSEAIEKQKAGS